MKSESDHNDEETGSGHNTLIDHREVDPDTEEQQDMSRRFSEANTLIQVPTKVLDRGNEKCQCCQHLEV